MVGSIVHVYLIWALMIGVGGSCSFTPIMSTLPKWFTKRRGVVIGIALAGVSLGGIIWPPVVERLITNIGWQSTYIVVGLITLVIITAAAQLMKQSPQNIGLKPYDEKGELESTPHITDQTAAGFTFAQAFKTATYWLIGLNRFCSVFVFQLISVHIFPHAVDTGLSEITAAIIMSIIFIGTTASRLLAGFVGDRIGHRLTLFFSTALLILSLVVLVFAKELGPFSVFAILFGLAWGGTSVVIVPLTAESFGPQSLGTIIGSIELFLATGGAIGVFIAGIVFDATGSYTTPFVICIIQALLAMLFSFMLIRYKHRGVVY